MNYLYFCLTFLFCSICASLTFLFCVRVLFLSKQEKTDPINVIKSPKKISAAKKIKQEEILNKLLENG